MYCFTLVQDLNCILKELAIWIKISREHTIFLKTIAGMADISLTAEVEEGFYKPGRRLETIEENKLFYGLLNYFDPEEFFLVFS